MDSKIHSVILRYNTVYSDGYRAVASHYGTLHSSDNTIYQAARDAGGQTAQAYQASGVLDATDDVVALSPGARLATVTSVAAPGSGPASTYPRIGAVHLLHITNPGGAAVVGPVVDSASRRSGS